MAGARSFEDLIAWKLSARLRDRVFEETKVGPVSRDFDFRDQIRDSSASAARNLAEGFGAFKPREFARFTRIARRSLMETRNHLLDGRGKNYFAVNTSSELLTLCRRALGATTGLLRYLDGCKGEAPVDWSPSARRRNPDVEPEP